MRKSITGGCDRPFYFRYHVRGYERRVHGNSCCWKSCNEAPSKKANKGVVQRAQHGLTGRTPEHLAISADIEQDVVQFI